jgi:hypothetical protein
MRNRIRRKRPPLTGLPDRLLRERNSVTMVLGQRWWEALLFAVGRWLLEYLTLLAALTAVNADPRPSTVLLAYCAAQFLGTMPLTPGGLGFVEAGLTGTLALAGVPAGAAVLATLAYRLVSFWLPIPSVPWPTCSSAGSKADVSDSRRVPPQDIAPSRHLILLCVRRMALTHVVQGRVVGEVEAERRHRDVAFVDSPEVGSLAVTLDRHDGEPVVLAAHRIGLRFDLPVVVVDRLSRPAQTSGTRRKVDVHEAEIVFAQEQVEGTLDPRLELREICILVCDERAERDPADAQESSLLRGREGA